MAKRPKRPRARKGIETRWRDGAWQHRVRYTDPVTRERRSEEFLSIDDADDFRSALRQARRSGRMLELTAGRELLADFVELEWWETYANVNLERATLLTYRSVWTVHCEPRLGHLQLRQIDPGVVAKFRQALEADGVGAPTIVKAMTMLQSVMSTAVVWGRAKSNPFLVVRKPRVDAEVVEPMAPDVVEAIAWSRRMVRFSRSAELTEINSFCARGRMLVYLIGYSGERPEEALALRWRHVRPGGTLLVANKNVDGVILPYQKVRGKGPRSVDAPAPLLEDLEEYRRAQGNPPDSAFVIPRPDGGPWRRTDYANWRRRRWQEGVAAAGYAEITITERDGERDRRDYDGPPPYWLRHSRASSLLHEGLLSPAEIAEQLGHSIQTLLKTYSHVMADLKGQPRVPVDDQIRAARARRAEAAALAASGEIEA